MTARKEKEQFDLCIPRSISIFPNGGTAQEVRKSKHVVQTANIPKIIIPKTIIFLGNLKH
jgi:hypothetical protein